MKKKGRKLFKIIDGKRIPIAFKEVNKGNIVLIQDDGIDVCKVEVLSQPFINEQGKTTMKVEVISKYS